MAVTDAEETPVNREEHTGFDDVEDKGKSFRKRRLSLTNLRQICDDVSNSNNGVLNEEAQISGSSISKDATEESQVDNSNSGEDKAHSFRKRRLSLTTNSTECGSQSENDDVKRSSKRPRKSSDNSLPQADSSRGIQTGTKLLSKTLHATGISSPSPSNSMALPKFYQDHAHSHQLLPDDASLEHQAPKWKKRHIRQDAEDDESLPFPRDVVGTFSCHGVEPIYDNDEPYHGEEEASYEHDIISHGMKPTMAAKTNQDRGGVAFPYGNSNRTALFAVYDGHGQGGELVSQYSLHEIQRLLEKHPSFDSDIATAFKETFLKVDSSLENECLIEPMYAGTTACVALLRGKQLVLSNAGDSRAVLGKRVKNKHGGHWEAIDLTEDQNPDLPSEQERIERMGGYVTPAPEPGLSSRVWLDKECSQIGLAMARSIGDHAVKSVGVIAEPVVTFHDISNNDRFLILATDGVWEFISSIEAVEIVSEHLEKGATKACQVLIETAAAKWHDEEGDYRDDITALVICLPSVFETSRY